MVKPRKFPQKIKAGSVSVVIYLTPVNGYDAYTLSWYEEGKRHRIVRGDYAEAKEEADDILRKLNLGIAPSQQLRGEDKERYLAAVAKLDPLGMTLGEAVQEYVNARRELGGNASISEAVGFFKAHALRKVERKTVEEAYELYKAQKESRTSSRNLETIKLHVGPFAKTFHCGLTDITHQQIDSWLHHRTLSPRYFNNRRAALVTFFRWCRKQRFLPDLETEAEKVEMRQVPHEFGKIFKPDQMKRLLLEVRADLVPYLALSAFAGLRPTEATRLNWENILWDQNQIRIAPDQALKTLKRRIVPLQPNLRAWLEPCRREEGKVAGFQRPHELLTKEIKKLDWLEKWPEDVLRHSYGSYRFAVTRNMNELAAEMGNSPRTIVKHYLEVATPNEGNAWFQIMPAGVELA